jgi:cytochrome b561
MTRPLPRNQRRQAARVEPRRFDAVTIMLHWTTLALIVGLFASAWLGAQATSNDQATLLLAIHRSFGIAVWSVTIGRLAWRVGFGSIPPLPTGMPRIQRLLAKANEYALYATLLIQPVTGMAQSLTRGRPFALFCLEAPKLMAKDRHLTALFHGIHEISAWVLIGLIGGHAMAALFHRFVLRDEVLQSMWPFGFRALAAKKLRGRE